MPDSFLDVIQEEQQETVDKTVDVPEEELKVMDALSKRKNKDKPMPIAESIFCKSGMELINEYFNIIVKNPRAKIVICQGNSEWELENVNNGRSFLTINGQSLHYTQVEKYLPCKLEARDE